MKRFLLYVLILISTICFLGCNNVVHSKMKQRKIPPLRKSIVDKNNTIITKAIRMRKLFLSNNIMDKKEFTNLINELSKIIPINRYVIHYYSDEYTNKIELPFKTIAYGISKENILKIENLLQNSFHLHKNDYYFVISGEKILYPYKNLFTPYIGYTRKTLKENYTYRKGIDGIQGYYELMLR